MIFIAGTPIEESLKQLLQRKVKIHLNNRVWRSGRCLLYKQSGFYLEIILKSSKRERFEVPIPFDIFYDKKSSTMYFDYRFSTLTHGNKELLEMINKIEIEKKSRFHDTLMGVEIIPDKNKNETI